MDGRKWILILALLITVILQVESHWKLFGEKSSQNQMPSFKSSNNFLDHIQPKGKFKRNRAGHGELSQATLNPKIQPNRNKVTGVDNVSA